MYIDLLKLFYADKENYTTTLNSRLNDPYAIYLDFSIGKDQVFFLLLPELLNSVGNIWRIDKSIYKLSSMLPGVAMDQFVRRCLIDEIELTNSIEGVYSSRREISEILVEIGKKDTRKRFWGIVNKYNLLIKQEKIPLETCADIRTIFDELVSAEIKEDDPTNLPDGEIFRKSSASVTSSTQRELHRGVYPEKAIVTAMNKALLILHDEKISVFLRIAAFHYLFGYIHPFYDGNGRTSRFISSYLLSLELEPVIGYRLSYTIRENLKEYYRAFEVCNHTASRGDITPFLIMFVGVIEKSMTLLEQALRKRKIEYDAFCEIIPQLHNGAEEKYSKLYDLLVQASLFSDVGISIRDLLEMLGISRQTLRNRLHNLDADLLVEKVIFGEKYYQLDITKLNQK